MKLLAITILIALLQTPTTGTGVIEGIVTRAGTGDPIAGAQIILWSSASPLNGFNGPSPIPPGTTGSDGRFSFKNMPAASYRIDVAANGYVRQEYGQMALNGTGKSVLLQEGQTLKDLSIALTPSSTVTGRILDDAGQPASDILVQLIEESYGPQGRTFRGVGMANADDRGEFRIFAPRPGRYYIVAGNVMVFQMLGRGSGDVSSIRTSRIRYPVTFFPGVSEMSAASAVELKSGTEFRADLIVNRQQLLYRVRGRVIDSETGQIANGARIFINPASSPPVLIQEMRLGSNIVYESGTFEFPSVPPGDWVVRAEIPVPVPTAPGPFDPATSAARNVAQVSRPFGQVHVHVTNSNVDGLVVTLLKGFAVAARIRVDGEPGSTVPNPDRVTVRFQASENGSAAQLPSATRVGVDGSFQIDGARAGEFLMTFYAISGVYVKSAKYGDQDVLYRPIRFTTPGTDTVEVVIRSGAGQIAGTVMDSKSQPVLGIPVILLPDSPLRNRDELYKTTSTDQNGRFTIANIAPGDYKVFSWEALPQSGYYDPEVMKKYESQGHSIHVVESFNETVDVKMIPAAE